MLAQQPEEDIFCPSCGYCLYGVEGDQCPECGAPFDLDDPDTYALRPPDGMGARGAFFAATGGLWVIAGMLLFLLLMAAARFIF